MTDKQTLIKRYKEMYAANKRVWEMADKNDKNVAAKESLHFNAMNYAADRLAELGVKI